jgi:hypothetical protein
VEAIGDAAIAAWHSRVYQKRHRSRYVTIRSKDVGLSREHFRDAAYFVRLILL